MKKLTSGEPVLQRGRRESNMWKWYALLSAVCAAMTAVLAKMGVRGVDADLVCAVRVSFVLILVWGIAIAGGKTKDLSHLTPDALLWLFLSAVATGLSWFFYFRALQDGDVSKVAPLDKLSVPIAMLLGFLFLGESLTLKTVAGGLLITAGALLLLM